MMSRAAQTHLAGRVFETPGLKDGSKTEGASTANLPRTAKKTDLIKHTFRHGLHGKFEMKLNQFFTESLN